MSSPSSSSLDSSSSPSAPKPSPLLSHDVFLYFIAGGCAGATSRTVVSPLERLKIIQQVQPATGGKPYKGVFRSLVRMYQEEGIRGYFRGNGINCIRIVPYSAVQFTAYETLKKVFTANGTRQLDTPTRLLAGALAGITSVSATYPLDLVRARLSIVSATITATHPAPTSLGGRKTPAPTPRPATMTASMSTLSALHASHPPEIPGMWGMTLKVIREEGGIRALYRGMIPTAVGVAPYVGINFAAYERLRMVITPSGQEHPVWRKLSCGALAGSLSQTLTYPFDVLRRKMQVAGMRSRGINTPSAFDVIRDVLRTQGPKGFYVGLWPNLLKVAPSIATSFYTYEVVKEFLTDA